METPLIPLKNLKKLVIVLFSLSCLTAIAISLLRIIPWQQDNQKTIVITEQLKASITEEAINFKELRRQNPDTVAWLKITNTNIDYPVVKTDNNHFYLTHDFNKQINQTGWIFADYRNNFEELDQNTIIYGHASINGLMFGTLKNITNQTITLVTENGITNWQVFSVYTIKATDDYLKTNFSDKEKEDYINLISSRSSYSYNTKPSLNDKILTLSTCHNKDERIVVHAKTSYDSSR